MKKRFLTGRGLLAAITMIAGGGAAFAFWPAPAGATPSAPQIGVVTGHSGGGSLPTLGHPKVAATAPLSPSYVAYDPSNGDEAVAVVATGAAHVYLIAGANEANEYHIETAPATFGTLVQGDAYLVAGTAIGTLAVVGDPGGGTTPGESPTIQATANGISPVSLVFDHHGDLLLGEAKPNTGPTKTAIQMVAKAACAATCAYGYTPTVAGGLYTLAGTGSVTAITLTQYIPFTFQVYGFSLSVDSTGNIIDGGNGTVLFLNEQASTVNRYGQTLPSHLATVIAGTGLSGTATCGSTSHNVSSTGSSSVKFTYPHPTVDQNGNVYVNDDRGSTAHKGCTWVLPASTGSLDGQAMTAGHMYSLTGATTTGAFVSGHPAVSTSFANASAVGIDPAGNVLIATSGPTPSIRVIAESNDTYDNQAMTRGDVYLIAGGTGAAGTGPTAAGFKFAGAARGALPPEYGITSLANGAAGDLLLTDGSSATTGNLDMITRGPTSPPSVTVTSVAPISGSTTVSITVTIHGTNFTTATSVQFGLTAATTLHLTSSTTLTVKDPHHAAGAVTVSVTAALGTGTKPTAFTYVAPTATTTHLTVTPASPTTHGHTVHLTVTITPAAAGTVQFYNGLATLGSPQTVSGGVAHYSTVLAIGTYSLKAKFLPTTPGAYATSTSNTVAYSVTALVTGGTVLQPFQGTITPGELTLSCTQAGGHYATTQTAVVKTCPLITFPKVTLNGHVQHRTNTMNPIYVLTARGTATAGWSLSAQMVSTTIGTTPGLNPNHSCTGVKAFCDSSDGTHATTLNGHGEIAPTLLTLSSATTAHQGYTCAWQSTTTTTHPNPSPTSLTFGTFGNGHGAPRVLTLCTATHGSSGGRFKVSGGTYKLTIPATNYNGTYIGTVEYSLVSH